MYFSPPYSTNHILSLWRCFRRCDVDDSEDVTRKCNFAFLLSFVDYSKSFVLKTVLLTSLNSIRMNGLGITRKKKYKFVYVRLGRPHKWKIDDLTSLIWWEWLRNAQKSKACKTIISPCQICDSVVAVSVCGFSIWVELQSPVELKMLWSHWQ